MSNARQLLVFLVYYKNFCLHLRFPTLSLGEMLYTQPSVREEALSLYVSYILFSFSCLFIWGVFTGFLHIWSIPCMLFIGLGVFLLFWCLIGPFNFCRASSRELRDLFYLLPLSTLFYSCWNRFCGLDLNLGLHMALAASGFDIFHDIYTCYVSTLSHISQSNQKGVDLLHFGIYPK